MSLPVIGGLFCLGVRGMEEGEILPAFNEEQA